MEPSQLMEKILITGATGLLGTTLVPYLRKSRYSITTLAKTGGQIF